MCPGEETTEEVVDRILARLAVCEALVYSSESLAQTS